MEKKISKELSFDTLNYHIKKLKENRYIELLIIEGKRGKKRDYCLTAQTNQDMKLGLMIINHNPNTNSIFPNHQEKKSIAYFLTICNIATRGKYLIVENADFDNGISAKDISQYYGGVYGFGYLKIKEETVQEVLLTLCNEGLIQKNNKYSDENRFFISDSDLKDFIIDLIRVFESAIYPRLILTWQHIRPPKPYEKPFFEIHYGNKSSERILHFKNILNRNKQKGRFKEDFKKWKGRIDNFDFEIHRYMKQLLNKHSRLFAKHLSIVKIMLEVLYPVFLEKEIENIENKYKNKKHPKLLALTPEGTINGDL